MLRLAAPLLLALAASAAAEETIWLRGRGDDVWIERDGEMREPRDDRKGLTIVSTPVQPPAAPDDTRAWRGGWTGGALLPPIPDHVSYPPYPYGADAPYLYGLGYLHPPRFWDGDDRGRRRFGGRHPGHFRDRDHGRHHFDDDRRHRHRFGGDERRRPEGHRGGHRHGGFGWRGGDRRGR